MTSIGRVKGVPELGELAGAVLASDAQRHVARVVRRMSSVMRFRGRNHLAAQ
jgi:hypothetical protein